MKVTYLIKILPTGEESWDKIVRTLRISPVDTNRLGKLMEDIERFRPVGSIATIQYSSLSIKISFLTAIQKEEFMNEYISDSRIIVNEKVIEFDDWRTKAMINKKFGCEFDAPITRWKFTAKNVSVESETRSLLAFDYARDEGYAYIYGCNDFAGLVDVLKRRYPNCEIKYELSYCSDDSRLVVSNLTIQEANNFLKHVKPHENPRLNLVDIEFEEREDTPFPGYTYTPRQESKPKYFAVSSEGYSPIRYLTDIPNCVWTTQTFEQTETRTLKAGDTITFDYDYTSFYPHVDIKETDEWPDIDKMWNMFTKHYPDEPIQTGVAIVKEEKDMAGYKLKDASSNLKLYMVEDKPTYTPRGAVRGVAHKVEELPEAIRNVQFNEKKGVTTIIWKDGDVTMAKCGPNDIWDPRVGLYVAALKKFFKSTTSMNKWVNEKIPEDPDPVSLFQGLIRKAFGAKDDLSQEEKAYCDKDAEAVKEAVESDRAEMLEKYESVKEG